MSRPPGLRLHPRTMMVQQAEAEFRVLVAQFCHDHSDLTDIELATIMTIAVPLSLKHALRAERHPEDPTRKADEE